MSRQCRHLFYFALAYGDYFPWIIVAWSQPNGHSDKFSVSAKSNERSHWTFFKWSRVNHLQWMQLIWYNDRGFRNFSVSLPKRLKIKAIETWNPNNFQIDFLSLQGEWIKCKYFVKRLIDKLWSWLLWERCGLFHSINYPIIGFH